MTEEAISKIERLVNDNKRVIQVPQEPNDVYYLRDEDGELHRIIAESGYSQAEFFTTESLLSHSEESGGDVALFVSDKHIQMQYTFSDSGRSVKHLLNLPKHPAYKLLESHLETHSYTQKELIRLLRAQLAGFVSDDLINQFRSLKLSANAEGSSVIDKGTEMLGKSVSKAIKGAAGELPESIMVTCPVFDIPELRETKFKVLLLVDIVKDEDAPKFELTTVHNNLMTVKHLQIEQLIEGLKSRTRNPVFYAVI